MRTSAFVPSTFAILAAMALPAQAAPVVFFGESTTACTTPGDRSTCSVAGAPLTANASFLAQLEGVGTETFEGFANGTGLGAALPIAFAGSTGSITATIGANSEGFVSTGVGFGGFGDTANFGRWNTSPVPGGAWYLSFNPFTITFDTPISAFGFFGTDVGDADGSLTLTLTAEGGATTDLVVGHSTPAPNGSLLFWGFIDATTAYTSIAFDNSAAGFDGFGFDGMTIGDREQVRLVPEPGALALLGLGLACLALRRKRA